MRLLDADVSCVNSRSNSITACTVTRRTADCDGLPLLLPLFEAAVAAAAVAVAGALGATDAAL